MGAIKIKTALPLGIALSVLSVAAAPALASVIIASTRVIYDAPQKEITVKLSNAGVSPALIQVWLDNGDSKAEPDTIDLPFTITPPVMRIDPDKSQTLRIAYTGEALPKDKESLFWLNSLEVPPKATASEATTNQLRMAFRTRIKFFYRPAHLKPTPEVAAQQLVWHLVSSSGGQTILSAHNPSPYYITVVRVEAGPDGKTSTDQDDMLGPGETHQIVLKGGGVASGTAFQYTTVNDYGGPAEHKATLAATGK